MEKNGENKIERKLSMKQLEDLKWFFISRGRRKTGFLKAYCNAVVSTVMIMKLLTVKKK